MMKHFYRKILIFIFWLFLAFGCGPTEPDITKMKNSLEYNWKIDTLRNPYNYGVVLWSIWGSSDSDIWVVGFNLAGQAEMFHYSLTEWNRVTPILGFNYELLGIIGFGSNEVYAVGSKIYIDSTVHTKSLIIKYDGTSWQVQNVEEGSGLAFINGYDSENIWACGFQGTIYKKNGNNWEKLPFDPKYDLGPIWVSSTGIPFLMYINQNYSEQRDTCKYYFSKFLNSEWNTIDSCTLISVNGYRIGYKFGERNILGISENQIFSVGPELYNFNGSDWQLIYWDDYRYKDIKENEDGIIFIVGEHGIINYLINNEWKKLNDFTQYTVDFYSIIPFNDKIFITGFSNNNGYIIKGILKY